MKSYLAHGLKFDISHKYGKEPLRIDKYTLNLHKPIQNRNMKCKNNANFVLPRYT